MEIFKVNNSVFVPGDKVYFRLKHFLLDLSDEFC